MDQVGKLIVFGGIFLVVIGLIVWLAGDKFTWFGNLPGDIKIEKEHFKLYAPFVSMILVSIVFSAIIWLVRKFL